VFSFVFACGGNTTTSVPESHSKKVFIAPASIIIISISIFIICICNTVIEVGKKKY